ncbi:PKD domain-containing protein [Carboxylicivirga sp. N1Y90]|uniref:PKD domain-containing protein n=1 Tax=Carboxylicivirga fragile TaxID=3417571 RepID=UPI003D352CF1|nr:PKD domain-containing protein [Marinilabiliaceae bacterium N1Y90]
MKTKLFLLSALIIFVFINSCSKDEDGGAPNNEPPVYTNGEGVIGTKGGTVKIDDSSSPLDGVELLIPEGALASDINIEISVADDVEFPFETNGDVIRFEPKGLTFNKPVELKLPYTSTDTTGLAVVHYDASIDKITEMPKLYVDRSSKTITATTTHFSTYLVFDKTKNVSLLYEMLNVDGTIGAKIKIAGNTTDVGMKYIRTTLLRNLADHETNAWDCLKNPSYKVYSLFKVKLRGYHWSSVHSYESMVKVDLQRTGGSQTHLGVPFTANAHLSNSSTPFQTGNLSNYDTNSSDLKALGRWFSGEPLIIKFDDMTNIDPDKKYFISLEWALASEVDGWTNRNYTPIFEFNSIDGRMKLSEMEDYSNDANNNNIDDDFEVWNEPVAEFRVSTTLIDKGQSVTFTDYSTEEPMEWLWNFGDGSTSTDKNPTHTYNKAGVYTVSLTVTNDAGSDTETKTNLITVNETGSAPVAAFSVNKTSITEGEAIIFTDQSANEPTSWSWNFGDGGTSSSQDKSHTYNAAGTYTVTLTATNALGSDTETKTDYITVSSNISIPEVSSGTVSNKTSNSASTVGVVANDGGETPSAVGFVWNTAGNPTLSNKTGYSTENYDENNGEFSGALTNLAANTTYYVRAYASNSAGTGYGAVHSFATLPAEASSLPDVSTGGQVKKITTSSAEITSVVHDDGGGALSARGIVWSSSIEACELSDADGNTNDGTATGSYLSQLSGLLPNTTYYVRGYATNSIGTAYGSPVIFNTLDDMSFYITVASPNGGENWEKGSTQTISWDSNVTGNVRIELWRGTILETNIAASIANTGSYTWNMTTGYQEQDDYKVKIVSVDDESVFDESDATFTISEETPNYETGTVTDIEGNNYKTVKIGTQWWMAENLKVTKYSDGTTIPHITDNTTWASLGDNNTDKAFCFYNNDKSLGYGALYTFAAAVNGTPHNGSNHVQGVCPTGWHLPSSGEWGILENYLIINGYNYNGIRRYNNLGKSLASKIGWLDSPSIGDVGNDQSTNNKTGFTALPSGSRDSRNGSFSPQQSNGSWWSSKQRYYGGLSYSSSPLYLIYNDMSEGRAVRCIKD